MTLEKVQMCLKKYLQQHFKTSLVRNCIVLIGWYKSILKLNIFKQYHKNTNNRGSKMCIITLLFGVSVWYSRVWRVDIVDRHSTLNAS